MGLRSFLFSITVLFLAILPGRAQAESPTPDLLRQLPHVERQRSKIARFSKDISDKLPLHSVQRKLFHDHVRRSLERMTLLSSVAADLENLRVFDPSLPADESALEVAYRKELIELAFVLHQTDHLLEPQRPSTSVISFLVGELDQDYGVLPRVVAGLREDVEEQSRLLSQHMYQPQVVPPRMPTRAEAEKLLLADPQFAERMQDHYTNTNGTLAMLTLGALVGVGYVQAGHWPLWAYGVLAVAMPVLTTFVHELRVITRFGAGEKFYKDLLQQHQVSLQQHQQHMDKAQNLSRRAHSAQMLELQAISALSCQAKLVRSLTR